MLLSKFEAYLKERLSDTDDLEVTQLTEITDGWETEIYSFDLERTEDSNRVIQKLVLRMYSGPWAKHKARKEFGLLKHLHSAGYPVPEVSLVEEDASPIGHPFIIMERIDGSSMWNILENEGYSKDSPLMKLFNRLFYDLHCLDWRYLTDNPQEFENLDSKQATLQWIEKYAIRAQEIGRHELFEITEWLKREIDNVAFGKLSATHNDFHPNNILLDKAGSPYVIDWTATDLFDYRVDLAWTLILAKVYVGDSLRDAVLQGYEEVSQKKIEDIHFFEVIGALRRLTDILVSLQVDSSNIGLRNGATDMIREQLSENMSLLDIVKDYTGIDLPETRRVMRGEMT